MDALPVFLPQRAFGPDESTQNVVKGSVAQEEGSLPAPPAEAATQDDAARCETFFFKEAEVVLQQLHTLSNLTHEAAVLVAEDATSEETTPPAPSSPVTQRAPTPATAAPVRATTLHANGFTGSTASTADIQATQATAVVGTGAAQVEHLTVLSVDLWLQRFSSTAAAVVHTLERYQEQPQLLDPYLPQQLDLLVQPIRRHLSLLTQHQQQQQSKPARRGWQAAVSCCCVRMLLHLVYVHCKVRGTKEIRSLLPQEPELLEQVLAAAYALQQQQHNRGSDDASSAGMAQDSAGTAEARAEAAAVAVCLNSAPLWSSVFALFAWLSLLVLAPFSLLSLDSNSNTNQQQPQLHTQQQWNQGLQQREEEQQLELAGAADAPLGWRLLHLALCSFSQDSKAADAAALLLQSLFRRPDTHQQEQLLLRTFLRHCELKLWSLDQQQELPPQQQRHEGACSLFGSEQTNAFAALQKVLKILRSEDAAPLLPRIQRLVSAQQQQQQEQLVASALFRKHQLSCAARVALLLLPIRQARWRYCVNARSLELLLQQPKKHHEQQEQEEDDQEAAGISEEAAAAVEVFVSLALQRLADSDSRVRWTAAKGLGRVSLALPKEFAEQVCCAVLQNFEAETLPLLPNAASGPAGEETGTAVAVAREGTATTSNDSLWRENISGASSAAGERLLSGTCLAIAELLRLGAVQQQQLPRALRFLCRGVLYAGRVSSSSSASGACVRDAACYGAWAFARSYSAASADLHLRRCLGRHLLLALLFDDSISIRRAAAAAFQEIEGRQGQLQQGLSIITIADYFTVGSRRSSFLTAAPAIAALEPQLMDHQQQQQQKEQPLSIVLLEYLCCRVYRHPDPQMRQLAAAAAARIIPFAKPYAASVLLPLQLQRLQQPSAFLEELHGAYLLLASLVEVLAAAPSPAASHAAAAAAGRAAATQPVAGVTAELGGEGGGTDTTRVSPAAVAAAAAAGIVDTCVQQQVRNSLVVFEKQRPYRRRGGDLLREAACSFMTSIAANSSWAFRSATCNRYLDSCFDSLKSFATSVQYAAAESIRALLLHRMLPQEVLQQILPKLLLLLEQQQQNVAARSGFLLALAALPAPVFRLELHQQQVAQQQEGNGTGDGQKNRRRQQLLTVLLQEATALAPLGCPSLNDPNTRRNALLCLSSLIEAVSPAHAAAEATAAESAQQDSGATTAAAARDAVLAAAIVDWEAIVSCLEACAADYSVDQRGDVGSWVREVAAEVAALILESFPCCCCMRTSNGNSRRSDGTVATVEQQLAGEQEEPPAAVGPNLRQRQQLLQLLLRLSLESLTRTRSRAAFLLSRLLAPRAAAATAAQMFKARWIWHRVLYEVAYEFAAQPHVDAAAVAAAAAAPNHLDPRCCCTSCGKNSGIGESNSNSSRCLMSPFVPSAMPLLQHAFGLLQLRQQQLDEGRSEEPFAQQQLSFLPPVQQLQQDTNSMSRSGKEEAIARSFVEGGVAALQRTHKAATALRLQVFCDAFQVYRHITPLLLLRQFAAAAASGAALGLGASLGSAAASIQGGAFSALLLAARMEQQQPQHQRSIVIGDDKATYTALLAEAWRARKEQEQQQLHHHHQQGRGTKEQGTVADVGSALVDVLLSTWEQPSNSAATETAAAASSGPTAKAGHAEYRRKLREAATSACALLLQNNFVAAIDMPRLLQALRHMVGCHKGKSSSSSRSTRNFDMLRRTCILAVSLAAATTCTTPSAEAAAAAAHAQRVSACIVINFLRHPFPKLRVVAAEQLYSFLLSLPPEDQSCPQKHREEDEEEVQQQLAFNIPQQKIDKAVELLITTPWVQIMELDAQQQQPVQPHTQLVQFLSLEVEWRECEMLYF